MSLHNWVRSTLGHGIQMCSKCKITALEAAALNRLNKCEIADVDPVHIPVDNSKK